MLRVAIILGSTRPGRKGEAVARWVYEIASSRGDAEFELVDIKEYDLLLLDEPVSAVLGRYSNVHTKVWSAKIASFDAFVFVTPEYNHATSGALKNAIGMEFVKIPAGEFMMGCSPDDNNCKNDEKPQHQVRITKAFEMGKYEVTQAQWKAMMMENQSAIVGDNRPVENVTRAEAIEFANRLNMRNDGYQYRLPTEAEWEYAARAGTKGATYGPLDEIAWYEKTSNDESHPVGTKKPNAWGLYDMIGNVREWTADTYLATYYVTSPTDDPPARITAAGFMSWPSRLPRWR